MLIFLKLYLAHLVAEFLRPYKAREKRPLSQLAVHLLIYLGAAVVFVNYSFNWRVALCIVLITLAHGVCDFLETKRDDWLAFTVDQLLHLLLIGLAAIWLRFSGFGIVTSALRDIAASKKLHLTLCGYLAVVFGGGFLVHNISKYFTPSIDPGLLPTKPGLTNAGRYIGWLERALVLTFLLTGYKEGIGLLLAAKTLVRYPEIKEDVKGQFAEYFLIGTLSSMGIAILVGLIILKLDAMP